MAPERRNKNATPFGRWLDRHNYGEDYAGVARQLRVTRERVRQLAQRLYPSLLFSFLIEDWTRSIDPDDFVDVNSWREVVATLSAAETAAPATAKPARSSAPSTRLHKSRLRR